MERGGVLCRAQHACPVTLLRPDAAQRRPVRLPLNRGRRIAASAHEVHAVLHPRSSLRESGPLPSGPGFSASVQRATGYYLWGCASPMLLAWSLPAGHEVEPLGTELQGPEEPRCLPASTCLPACLPACLAHFNTCCCAARTCPTPAHPFRTEWIPCCHGPSPRHLNAALLAKGHSRLLRPIPLCSLPAAGGAGNGPSRAGEGVAAAVSPRRARLEAMFRETQARV